MKRNVCTLDICILATTSMWVFGLSPVVGNGDLDIAKVKMLLERGENPDKLPRPGRRHAPILWVAAERGQLDVVRLLLQHGADINVTDWQLRITALHSAANRGDVKVADFLISNGADVNVNTSVGTALHWAARGGKVETARLLIEKGTNVNTKAKVDALTALHRAAEGGHSEVAELPVANGADVNAKTDHGDTALQLAAWRGSRPTVDVLLQHGAEMTPHVAAFVGDLKVLARFLGNGGDVNAKDRRDRTLLHWARDRETAAFLIARGADVNAMAKDGWAPLHRAALSGDCAVAQLLLESGVDVDSRTIHGTQYWPVGPREYASVPKNSTPLHVATYQDRSDVATLLIEKGANIGARDGDGYLPIHCAARSGAQKVTALLLAKGAEIDAQTVVRLPGRENGLTALRICAMYGQADVADFLIKAGAKVNAMIRNQDGPLHDAARCGQLRIAELLLKHGADVNARGKGGDTPSDRVWGIDSYNDDVAAILRQHGGKRGKEIK